MSFFASLRMTCLGLGVHFHNRLRTIFNSINESMMLSSQMFFCQECGAANTGDATTCFACHEPLNLSGASLASAATFNAQSVSSAPGIQGIQGIHAFHMPPVTILPAVPTGTGLTTVAGPLGQGAVLNGRYTILDEVGQGGYGTVFKARDMKQKNKVVAIKQIDLSTLSTLNTCTW